MVRGLDRLIDLIFARGDAAFGCFLTDYFFVDHLIEDGLPVIVVMPSPKGAATLHSKLLSNIREIQSRGAVTIVIAEEGDDTVRPYADHLIEIPSVSTLLQPLLSTIPLQVFAASVAQARGYDVDKPRNLAKSVTVE